jgi:hypothetical protein
MYYEKHACGNDLAFIDELLQNMLLALIEYGSDDFWKVLKYGTKDALTNATYTITREDKYELVSSSNPQQRVKLVAYNSDISTEAHNEVRIYDIGWTAIGRDDYSVRIGFDVICHNANIVLQGGRRAHSLIRSEILSLFNNARVDKNIGLLTVDGEGGTVYFFNSEYQGYRFGIAGSSS